MFPKNILLEKKGPRPGAPQIWAPGPKSGPLGPNWGPGPEICGLGPKFEPRGPKFGPRGPNLGPWAQIWAQGPKSGGARARAPSFPIRYFLETRIRILTTPTFKEKLSLQASRAFPEGAPRKVSMFKIYLAGRSSDMSISCPETIFVSRQNGDIQVADFSGF